MSVQTLPREERLKLYKQGLREAADLSQDEVLREIRALQTTLRGAFERAVSEARTTNDASAIAELATKIEADTTRLEAFTAAFVREERYGYKRHLPLVEEAVRGDLRYEIEQGGHDAEELNDLAQGTAAEAMDIRDEIDTLLRTIIHLARHPHESDDEDAGDREASALQAKLEDARRRHAEKELASRVYQQAAEARV